MKTSRIAWAGVLLTSLATLFVACSKAPETPQATASDPGPAPVGRLGTTVVPEHYRLELRVDPREDNFSGMTSIDLAISEPVNHIWLHGKDLEVTEIYLVGADGERVEATYEQVDDTGVALVTLDGTVAAGKATLNITYFRPFNTSTNALFKVVRGEDSYAASQMQPIGARQVFPGFDEPAFKVPFDLVLVTRPDDAAITTTPESGVEELEDGFVRRTFATTRPMPTYLLAFAVGPYDIVDYGMIPANSVRDREVPLRAIVSKGMGSRAEYALRHTEGLMTVLEEYFGTPYPYRKLDLIAVPESFGGAMENIGAIVYDEYILLMDDESPLQQRRTYTAVHAHEIAHMWFGNLVTPEWWNDLWLNESFATWMMYKASDLYWPDGEFDRNTLKSALGAMGSDSLAAAREIREPIEHSNRISGAFDAITYQKGGGVLSMLERYVGEEEFRQGVQLHMERREDQVATAEHFIAAIAEGSDRTEIEGAFRSFISQPGVPLVSVTLSCPDGGNPQLLITQERYAPLGSAIDPDSGQWQIPMCVRYEADGQIQSSCSLLAEKSQQFELETSSCPDWLHPNADGAGYYRFSLDDAGWQALIENATKLAPSEALVLAGSLDAGLRAGAVSAENYVQGMAALLQHDAWDVVDWVSNFFEGLTNAVHHTELEPVEAAYRALLGPIYADLDPTQSPGHALLRNRLLRFLIVIAKDQEMRAPLAEQAAAYIGIDGEPDPSAATQSELETVLSVGVQDIGEPFFDLLLEKAIASQDPTFRGSATGALARVEDPALVKKLQAAVMAGDFDGVENLGIIARQMVRSATTELTFDWMREADDEFIALVPETFRPNFIPGYGSSLCTAEAADQWQSFIESHADKLPGYERDLAQAVESARLCAALREASQDDIIEAFTGVM